MLSQLCPSPFTPSRSGSLLRRLEYCAMASTDILVCFPLEILHLVNEQVRQEPSHNPPQKLTMPRAEPGGLENALGDLEALARSGRERPRKKPPWSGRRGRMPYIVSTERDSCRSVSGSRGGSTSARTLNMLSKGGIPISRTHRPRTIRVELALATTRMAARAARDSPLSGSRSGQSSWLSGWGDGQLDNFGECLFYTGVLQIEREDNVSM